MYIQEHKEVCPNVEALCTFGCGVSFKRGELSKHAAVCSKRPTNCTHCHQDIPLDSLEVKLSHALHVLWEYHVGA